MQENRVSNELAQPKEILASRWQNFCHRLNLIDNGQEFDYITTCYSEKHRAYHTLQHIKDCFDEFDKVRNLINDPDAIEMAIWFHDIVYTIGRSDNEEKSAETAKEFCQKNNLPQNLTNEVETHILATKNHLPSNNLDSNLLLDIDMAILGQREDVFDQYENNIYKEYSSKYSLADYKKGRKYFLESTLKQAIYISQIFRDKYEQKARGNIIRTINNLSK